MSKGRPEKIIGGTLYRTGLPPHVCQLPSTTHLSERDVFECDCGDKHVLRKTGGVLAWNAVK